MNVRIVASLAVAFGMSAFVGVISLAQHHHIWPGMALSFSIGLVSSLGFCLLDKRY